MKVQQTIKTETVKIAVGTLLLTCLMIAVFIIFDMFNIAVVVGAVIGYFAAVLDFFLLGLTVQKAAQIQAEHPLTLEVKDAEAEQREECSQLSDPETANRIKKTIRQSYYARRLMLLCFAALGLTSGINLIATVVPMLFPKLVIQLKNIAGLIPKGVGKK